MNKGMVAFIGILLGLFSSYIMQTVLAAVLPSVIVDLGGQLLYSWAFSGYLIVSTISIPSFAKLADLFGRKRFYLMGMLIFLAGSALLATVHSMEWFVILRMLQGLGAGAVAPAAIAMISDLFPIEKRGKMMGSMATTLVLANVVGPLAGGLIADYFSWRWAFWATLPTGILATLFVFFAFKESIITMPEIKLDQIDLLGGLLLGIATVLVIQSLKFIATNGIWHIQTGLFLLMTICSFGLFLKQEKSHPNPVISLNLMKIPNIIVSLGSTFILGVIMYGLIVVLPLFAQMLYGETALAGSRLLIPLALGLGAGGILSGKLNTRLSCAGFAVGGWLAVSVGFSLLALTSRVPNYFILINLVILIGLGLGALFPTFLLLGQNAVAENQRAVMGGLIQMCRNIGGALGIPLLMVFITDIKHNSNGSNADNQYLGLFLTLAVMSVFGIFMGASIKGSNDQNS